MEEKRSRWAGRTSNPVGAAERSRAGSTPALFRLDAGAGAHYVAVAQQCDLIDLSGVCIPRLPWTLGLMLDQRKGGVALRGGVGGPFRPVGDEIKERVT